MLKEMIQERINNSKGNKRERVDLKEKLKYFQDGYLETKSRSDNDLYLILFSNNFNDEITLQHNTDRYLDYETGNVKVKLLIGGKYYQVELYQGINNAIVMSTDKRNGLKIEEIQENDSEKYQKIIQERLLGLECISNNEMIQEDIYKLMPTIIVLCNNLISNQGRRLQDYISKTDDQIKRLEEIRGTLLKSIIKTSGKKLILNKNPKSN